MLIYLVYLYECISIYVYLDKCESGQNFDNKSIWMNRLVKCE